MKKILGIVIVCLFLFPLQVLATSGGSKSITVHASPSGGVISSSSPVFNRGFNITDIPSNADILNATLSFGQQVSSSSETASISISSGGSIIATESLYSTSPPISHSFSNLAGSVQSWLSTGHNGNLTFSASGIGAGESIAISSIQIQISYKTKDNLKPEISNIAVSSVTETTVKITWKTNEATLGFVDYGTTTAYGLAVAGKSYIIDHGVAIHSLSPGTVYNFRIHAKDSNGNETISPNHSFRTTGQNSMSQSGVQGIDTKTAPVEEVLLPPANVRSLFRDEGSKIKVILNWDRSRSDDIDGYRIYKAADNPELYEFVGDVNTDITTFEDDNVNKDVKYFYFLRSYKGSKESVDSNVTAVKIEEEQLVAFLPGAIQGPNFWINLAGLNLVTIGILAIIYLIIKIAAQVRKGRKTGLNFKKDSS